MKIISIKFLVFSVCVIIINIFSYVTLFADSIYLKNGTVIQNVSDIKRIGDNFLYNSEGKKKSTPAHRISKITDSRGNITFESVELTYTKTWDDAKGYIYDFKRNSQSVAVGLWDDNGKFIIEKGIIPDGIYNEYYSSGTLKSFMTFSKNNLNGVSKFYYETGVLSREGSFVNGKEEGISKLYNIKGNLSGTSEYKDGMKNGITKIYYDDNNIKAILNYRNGNVDGIQKTFYPSGQLQTLVTFKNGVRNGLIEEYYENGKLMLKGNFVNGLMDGSVVQYYESGRIKSSKVFKQDKLIN